eukprot:maker-scaffold_3-snap-gene-11.0-mRNA-1 protein AED:0.01 eAED:0.01 QI:31/0.5/0.66/1/1/1/3/260/224
MAYKNNQMAAGPPSYHLNPTIYKMFALKKRLPQQEKIEPANYGRPVSSISEYPEKEQVVIDKISTKERQERKVQKIKDQQELLKENIRKYKNQDHPWKQSKYNPEGFTDRFKNTLFIGRLNYETTEETLKSFFSKYGVVKRLFLIKNMEGKSRGYAFLEMANTHEANEVYRSTHRARIDGREILVDYERARKDKHWLPRRLGGGLGSSRRKKSSRRDRDTRFRR